jgi:peptidoglycan DL-endopeptidase CwlO
MGAHRSRHGTTGGLRHVSEILAQVTSGSGGTAALQSQRSVFAVAAAATVGAGTAAAAATGTFPAIQAPDLPGLTDTHAVHQIVQPVAPANPAGHVAAGQAATPAPSVTPASFSAISAPAALPANTGSASGGTVMATDLHQTDAQQIASLSHAVSMAKPVTQSAPAAAQSVGGGGGGGSVAAANPLGSLGKAVGGLVGGAVSTALQLPSSLNGVAITGGQAGSPVAAMALRKAVTKKGLPYIWGGTGPNGFDCSGLIQWAYKQLGIKLPRTSSAQSQVGVPVSKSQLKPGDLVFFYSPVSHVGIYIGNNKIFNASESGEPLKVSDMSHMPFHSARRIVS